MKKFLKIILVILIFCCSISYATINKETANKYFLNIGNLDQAQYIELIEYLSDMATTQQQELILTKYEEAHFFGIPKGYLYTLMGIFIGMNFK